MNYSEHDIFHEIKTLSYLLDDFLYDYDKMSFFPYYDQQILYYSIRKSLFKINLYLKGKVDVIIYHDLAYPVYHYNKEDEPLQFLTHIRGIIENDEWRNQYSRPYFEYKDCPILKYRYIVNG